MPGLWTISIAPGEIENSNELQPTNVGRTWEAGREGTGNHERHLLLLYWCPALRSVVASHSRPSYRPSPDVAQVDWMYCHVC